MENENNLNDKNIVFFDGVCNMCNGLVSYLMKKDKNKVLHYSSLQSDFARQVLKQRNIVYGDDDMITIYFLTQGKLFSFSTAILKILSLLNPFYAASSKVLLLINRGLRDKIYGYVSKNRYKFFGKQDTCRLPTRGICNVFTIKFRFTFTKINN